MSGKPKITPGAVMTVQTGWRDTVLICRKCSKKLDGGFGKGGEQTLRTALRERLRETGQRRAVRIIETGCFGVCPKRAVVACLGRQPERLLVLGEGADVGVLAGTSPPAG